METGEGEPVSIANVFERCWQQCDRYPDQGPHWPAPGNATIERLQQEGSATKGEWLHRGGTVSQSQARRGRGSKGDQRYAKTSLLFHRALAPYPNSETLFSRRDRCEHRIR